MNDDDEARRLFAEVDQLLSRRAPRLDAARVRRNVLEAHASRRGTHAQSWRRFALPGLAALSVVALALFTIWGSRRPTAFEVAGKSGQVGALLQADPARPLPLLFSEGTRVSFSAGSRGRVAQVTRSGARVEIDRGSLRAQVQHLPGAAWTFAAGPFEVDVLGTELSVGWDAETRRFELQVLSGLVRLRGPLARSGQEIRAGQVCRIDLSRGVLELGSVGSAPPPTDAVREPAAAPKVVTEPEPSEVSAPSASPAEPTKPLWASLARSGKPREAVAAAEKAGLSGVYRKADSDSLLELARAARLAGRNDVERAALLACRKQGPGQAAAAQAAYLLGRASAPAEAATWFETYLREQPHGLLAREAAGRIVESQLAAANTTGAAEAARRYLAVYPNGPHASLSRQVLGSSERR